MADSQSFVRIMTPSWNGYAASITILVGAVVYHFALRMHSIPRSVYTGGTSWNDFPVYCKRAADIKLLSTFGPLEEWRYRMLSQIDEQRPRRDKDTTELIFETIEQVVVTDVKKIPAPKHPDGERVIFATIDVYWRAPKIGDPPIERTVFLRGPSAAMLVILQPDDAALDEELYVVLTTQLRTGGGYLEFTEIPAGMVEEESFVGAATREIQEEVCMTVAKQELLELKPPGMGSWLGVYPSAGALDESIKYYVHHRQLPRMDLESLQGRWTGEPTEDESIRLSVVPMEDMLKFEHAGMDGKAIIAYTFYNLMRKDEKGRESLEKNIVRRSLDEDKDLKREAEMSAERLKTNDGIHLHRFEEK